MPSALLSAGGSVDSSTPGGAFGDPLSATYTVRPFGLTRIPRGRLPTGIVATTLSWWVSITEMSFESSLLMYTNDPASAVAVSREDARSSDAQASRRSAVPVGTDEMTRRAVCLMARRDRMQ